MDYRANPLLPIPKIYIPTAAALVVILISWIVSGDFARAESAALLTAIGYAVIGYVVPTDGVGTRRHITPGPAHEADTRTYEPPPPPA